MAFFTPTESAVVLKLTVGGPSLSSMAGLTVAGLVVLFITYLLPKLTTLIESTRGSLPPMAKGLLRISEVLKHNWWLFLLLIAIGTRALPRPQWTLAHTACLLHHPIPGGVPR